MERQSEPLDVFRAFDALPDAVVVTDPEGMICYANPQALDLLGYCPESLIGQTRDQIGMIGVPLVLDKFSPALSVTTTVRTRRAETIPVQVSVGTADRGAFLISVIREVRITESEVVASVSTNGTSILDTLAEGVLVVDANESVTYANRQAMQLIGDPAGSHEQLELRNLLQPVAPDAPGPGDVSRHFLEMTLSDGRTLEDIEAVLIREDGTRASVSLNSSPVYGDGQSTSGAVISFIDISRQKQSERQMSVQRQVLESIASGEEFAEAAKGIIEFVEEAVPGTRAALYLLDQETHRVESVAALTVPEELHSTESPSFDESARPLFSHVISSNHSVMLQCPDYAEQFGFSRELASRLQRNGVHACWCYPVISSTSSSAGVLCLYRDQPGMPTTSDQGLVESAIDLARVALDRAQIERDLRHQSFNDSLTGLPNRILLMDRLELALQRARRSDNRVALLLLDMDQFQMINDSLGHAAGDQFLKEAADRLRTCLRQDDLVARFTSDEFGILLEHIGNESDAINVVMRIQRAFALPLKAVGVEIYASVSIGVALAGDQETVADALVRYADIAMHRAKESGRGQFAIFSPSQDLSRVPKIALQSRLHHALAADALKLHYQPVVALEDSSVAGYEALVRWHDEQFGQVSPDEFLPLAQQSGIMSEITAWVLDRAVSQAKVWRETYDRPIFVGVNVSPGELNDPLLVEQVAAVIERYRIDPGSLFLEMTEHALVEITGRTGEILKRLRGLGIRIALDDFGTGFSSLSYLERLPVDCIKIDRSFVQAARGGASRAPVAAAMVDLARKLGMLSVAEGIETEEDERVARQLGCDYSQGYFYGRPQPEHEDEQSP